MVIHQDFINLHREGCFMLNQSIAATSSNETRSQTEREMYDLAKEIYAGLSSQVVMLDEEICFDCLVLNAKRAAQAFVERYETIDDAACED